ncbi:hypothetical protein NFY79_001210 [Escherichia coli]|uniref:hypothetical protein n=2 Tax=Escherichia coli TaxID=562 RepID=UPI000BE9469D|nr:hypothetical protein [Escherichia coli]EEZ0888451.1 hypothetical protein [Escherichia coli]EFO1987765.1 hypothetical protein [Escherichia coli]EIA9489877.1 hypothetical protein [Escherichia coli]EJH6503186.1 hypothetical protein [Escherichia coli]ELU2272828.1 hypothetical protein [Escherichia coli]
MKKLLLALLVSGYCHAEGLPACDDASVSKQVEGIIAKELAVYNPNFLSDYSVTLYKPRLTKTEDNINYCTSYVTFVNNKTKDDKMVSDMVFEILSDGKIEFSTYILSRVWSGGVVNFLALDENRLRNYLDRKNEEYRKEQRRLELEKQRNMAEEEENKRLNEEKQLQEVMNKNLKCDNQEVIQRLSNRIPIYLSPKYYDYSAEMEQNKDVYAQKNEKPTINVNNPESLKREELAQYCKANVVFTYADKQTLTIPVDYALFYDFKPSVSYQQELNIPAKIEFDIDNLKYNLEYQQKTLKDYIKKLTVNNYLVYIDNTRYYDYKNFPKLTAKEQDLNDPVLLKAGAEKGIDLNCNGLLINIIDDNVYLLSSQSIVKADDVDHDKETNKDGIVDNQIKFTFTTKPIELDTGEKVDPTVEYVLHKAEGHPYVLTSDYKEKIIRKLPNYQPINTECKGGEALLFKPDIKSYKEENGVLKRLFE